MHHHDGAVLGHGSDVLHQFISGGVLIRIAGGQVVLNGRHTRVGGEFNDPVVNLAVGRTKQRGLPAGQGIHHLLGPFQFIAGALIRHLGHVGMEKSMIAQLELRYGRQVTRLFRVFFHPLAAEEQGRRRLHIQKYRGDAWIVLTGFGRGTGIEGEGHHFNQARPTHHHARNHRRQHRWHHRLHRWRFIGQRLAFGLFIMHRLGQWRRGTGA